MLRLRSRRERLSAHSPRLRRGQHEEAAAALTFVREPFGTWTSPITADLVARSSLRLSTIVLENGDIYWLEGRPEEGGRNVIVRRSPDGHTIDVTPPGTNVRTRVHEYGGAAFTVHGQTIYYSEF